MTALFVPSRPEAKCPSELWWTPDGDDEGEEARVAYVAATRSRGAFILGVHTATLERLRAKRPEFVALFEIDTLEGN